MTIYTVNYREKIFEHTDLTKITGVLTYETLHLIQNEIKANAMAVHSNIIVGQHGYLKWVFIPTAYSLLTKNSIFSSSASRKPQHPYSGYPSRPRRTETPIQRKHTSLLQNKRSGISAHTTTRVGRRSKIHHSHEKQDHWPIHRHPLHDHPLFDCHVR